MLRYDRRLKRPSHHNSEHFLNLVRLAFLSMPMYVLRTLNPLHCVAYRRCSTDLWRLGRAGSQVLERYTNTIPPERGEILFTRRRRSRL
jgi:hypothetical protein